jgi:hypothetical protein
MLQPAVTSFHEDDELRVIPIMAISNLTISCVKITVDLMISGEVNFLVTIGWIPNCKANRPIKKRAIGESDDDDDFVSAMVK